MSDEAALHADAELKIRGEGRAAQDAGQPVTACPHPAESKAHYQWVSGWMQPDATAPEDES